MSSDDRKRSFTCHLRPSKRQSTVGGVLQLSYRWTQSDEGNEAPDMLWMPLTLEDSDTVNFRALLSVHDTDSNYQLTVLPTPFEMHEFPLIPNDGYFETGPLPVSGRNPIYKMRLTVMRDSVALFTVDPEMFVGAGNKPDLDA